MTIRMILIFIRVRVVIFDMGTVAVEGCVLTSTSHSSSSVIPKHQRMEIRVLLFAVGIERMRNGSVCGTMIARRIRENFGQIGKGMIRNFAIAKHSSAWQVDGRGGKSTRFSRRIVEELVGELTLELATEPRAWVGNHTFVTSSKSSINDTFGRRAAVARIISKDSTKLFLHWTQNVVSFELVVGRWEAIPTNLDRRTRCACIMGRIGIGTGIFPSKIHSTLHVLVALDTAWDASSVPETLKKTVHAPRL